MGLPGELEETGCGEMEQGAVPRKRHDGDCLTTLQAGQRHGCKRRSFDVKRPGWPRFRHLSPEVPLPTVDKLPFSPPLPWTNGDFQTYCQYKNGGPIFAESLGNLTV